MANTLVKVYIHIVFHVKHTKVMMRNEDLNRIFSYIGGIIKGIDSIPMEVGGVNNHVHIVASLPKTRSLSDFVRIIKSDSSRWIKKIDKHYDMFEWQEGYGAFSVSSTILERTVNYVRNQSEHHKTMTFKDEYKSFLKEYKIQCDEKYIFDD